MYVPFRNQHLITTTIPISWGYQTPQTRSEIPTHDYFVKLFEKISITDNTPYMCVPVALKFRDEVCGGEARIRGHCMDIARTGGAAVAEQLGTEVLEAKSDSGRNCCFAVVRLPIRREELCLSEEDGPVVAKWMQEKMPAEYETYIPIKFFKDGFWCRLSDQIYLTLEDSQKAATILIDISHRAKAREWAT